MHHRLIIYALYAIYRKCQISNPCAEHRKTFLNWREYIGPHIQVPQQPKYHEMPRCCKPRYPKPNPTNPGIASPSTASPSTVNASYDTAHNQDLGSTGRTTKYHQHFPGPAVEVFVAYLKNQGTLREHISGY
ncbi:hypothetical protein B0H10DRAFT_2037239 [Mycena sp. CBHHK59/15]|nr:hypothetical protein B0H10DRAFT_2037239 [Mycena sp. CBHHK59/15]